MFICYFKGTESKDFNVACGETPVVNGTTFKNDGNYSLNYYDLQLTCFGDCHNSDPKKYLHP